MAVTLRVALASKFALRAGEAALQLLWRLATSVRAAIVTVLLLGIASLLGVLLPQIPVGVRGRPLMSAAWLELQRPRFGFLTPTLHRLGLFDVFHAWWFWGLVGWLAIAVVVCTYSRIPAIWHQAAHPPERVPDGLFARQAVVQLPHGATPAGVARRLRRRLFKVRLVEDHGSTYLFADRFPWTQLGTFVSHLALILFLTGALVTKFDGFSTYLAIGEGASAPVFPVAHERQILVEVLDAVGSFDEHGRPLDYHSDLVLYRNGEEVKRCTTTVNDPCSLDGYSFHQSGFFGFGGELRVRDVETGNTVYREVLALDRPLPVPQVTIRDVSGTTVFDGVVPQTDLVEDALGGLLPLPESNKVFWIGLRGGDEAWTLVVFDPSLGESGESAIIPVGADAQVAGHRFTFTGVTAMPSLTPGGVPLPVEALDPEDDGRVLLALENAVFGTDDASAGDERFEQSSNEPPVLHIAGIAPVTVRLAEGDRVQLGPYEYEFLGPRNFTGISVRRDRGDTLIWIASGLFLFGLLCTLWFPRQRAWLRFTRNEVRVFSQGRAQVDASSLLGDDA